MNLSFFQPSFLWGLLGIALPVAVHFFNRKRTVDLYISSTRFFEQTAVKANRSRTVRHWLQLIVRCLLVILLSLIFSRPYNKTDPFAALKNPGTPVYCWTDPTISMTYAEHGVSCAETARRLTDSLDARLPPSASLYRYNDREKTFTQRGEQKIDKEDQPRYTRNGFGAMVAVLKKQVKKNNTPPILFIFSDFQTTTTASVDSFINSDSRIVPVVCVSLAPDNPWNYGLGSTQIAAENPSVLETTVHARGNALNRGTVSVLNGAMRAGHLSVSVKADDSARTAVEIASADHIESGEVKLDINDPFQIDNVDYFVRQEAQSFAVLIVGDSAESYPVASALVTADSKQWQPIVLKTIRQVTAADLNVASLVILNNIGTAAGALGTFISGRLSGKRAVIFSPGLTPQTSEFNRRILELFGINKSVNVDTSSRGLMPMLSDTVSTLWRGFPRVRDRDVAVYHYLSMLPGDRLITLENNRPLACRSVDRAGNCWILLSTTMGVTQSNNLWETGFYVPFIDRLARHACAQTASASGRWIAGEMRPDPFFGSRVSARIFTSDNTFIAAWGSQPFVQFDRPGIYKIQPSDAPAYQVSVHVDPAETDLHYTVPAPAQAKKQQVKIITGNDFMPFIDGSGTVEILWVLWALAALALLAEMLLWQKPIAMPRKKPAA